MEQGRHRVDAITRRNQIELDQLVSTQQGVFYVPIVPESTVDLGNGVPRLLEQTRPRES